MIRPAALLTVFSLASLLVAAADPGPARAEGEEVLVSAAASLRQPFEAIAQRYEAAHPGRNVVLVFGASNVLARQIEAGAPVDVFASADDQILDGLDAQGLTAPGSRLVLAGNRLVVIASPTLQVPLKTAEDLLRPEVRRIALPDVGVPVGRYAREWLERRHLAKAVESRAVRSEDARAALAAVDAGNAEAAIVYATDVRVAHGAKLAFEIPAIEQPRIVYTAAIVAGSKHPAFARDFLLFLAGDTAAQTLREAGFSPPLESQ